jgi:hypothetical protein
MQTDALQQKLEVNDYDEYDDNGEEEEPMENQGKNTDEGDNNEEVQCNDARSRHDGSSPVLERVSNSRSAGDISLMVCTCSSSQASCFFLTCESVSR